MNSTSANQSTAHSEHKKTVSAAIFLAAFIAFFALFAFPMGLANMLNTMMNTAYQLLLDTTFYILSIAVLASAISSLLSEFGVIDLLNKMLSPLMRPLYGMPGAAALGIVTTYFSDNPAILSLADDVNYKRYFKAYQIPALTNIGTAFGMGLVVTTYMLGLHVKDGSNMIIAAFCGNIGAIVGSILSARLMMHHTKKVLGKDKPALDDSVLTGKAEEATAKKSMALRILDALIEGGKNGVDLGLGIIPGVLIICTIVMMLTNGASADGSYTGAAYEGIAVLPMLSDKLSFILQPLFGFSSPSCVAVPVTALGSAGAALGIIPGLIKEGLAGGNDIAVFTAMCMCWSGYLSTHVSMMDMLKCSHFTEKAIISHTFGGLLAGVTANWLYKLIWNVIICGL